MAALAAKEEATQCVELAGGKPGPRQSTSHAKEMVSDGLRLLKYGESHEANEWALTKEASSESAEGTWGNSSRFLLRWRPSWLESLAPPFICLRALLCCVHGTVELSLFAWS